jgi:hypothetical protein
LRGRARRVLPVCRSLPVLLMNGAWLGRECRGFGVMASKGWCERRGVVTGARGGEVWGKRRHLFKPLLRLKANRWACCVLPELCRIPALVEALQTLQTMPQAPPPPKRPRRANTGHNDLGDEGVLRPPSDSVHVRVHARMKHSDAWGAHQKLPPPRNEPASERKCFQSDTRHISCASCGQQQATRGKLKSIIRAPPPANKGMLCTGCLQEARGVWCDQP